MSEWLSWPLADMDSSGLSLGTDMTSRLWPAGPSVLDVCIIGAQEADLGMPELQLLLRGRAASMLLMSWELLFKNWSKT